MVWINAIIQGILLGGLYALFATGLSMAFGVMRFVNLAHGDLAIVAAFFAFSLQRTFELNPLLSLLIILPGAFVVGYLLQRVVFDRVVGVDPAFQIVATFGLSMVLQPRFDAEDMLRLIEKHRVTHMHIVPTMFVRLLRLPDEAAKEAEYARFVEDLKAAHAAAAT